MSDDVAPLFSFEVRRRSSKLSALTAVVLLSVSCLWVTTWGGRQVYNVKAYHDKPLPSLSNSPSPFAASLAGLEVQSHRPPRHSAAIRFIDVTGNFAELFEGGQLRAVITLQAPLVKGNYVISLRKLAKALHRPTWLTETSPGVFAVRAGLMIEQGAVVDLHAPEVTTINLIDRPGVYFALSGAGTSTIRGVTIQVPHAPAWVTSATYRPFVNFADGADVRLSNVRALNLGWDWTDSWGLTWSNGATGSLTSSVITGNYVGVSAVAASHLAITHCTISQSKGFGVRITKRSDYALIDHNVITHNRSDAVTVDSYSLHASVTNNNISANQASGVLAWGGVGSLGIDSNNLSDNLGDGIFLSSLVFATSIQHNTLRNDRIGVSGNGQEQGSFTGNVIAQNQMSVQGITYNAATNTVDPSATGYATIPPSKWWRIVDLLVAAGALGLVLFAVRVRRQTLRRGWEIATANEDGAAPRRLTTGYRHALAEAARQGDASSPIGPVERLAFVPREAPLTHGSSTSPTGTERVAVETWLRTGVFVVIALLVTAQLIGGIGLFADGGYFFYRILQSQSHLIISSGRSFVQYVTQEPLILALHFHVHQIGVLRFVWTASLVLEPVAVWVAALVIVRKHHMFWYFVLAFFVIYGYTSGFIIGEYNLAYGLAAACAAQLFAGLGTARARWRLVGLAACTVLSYPVMVILGPALLTLVWWTYRKTPAKTSPLRYTCGFVALAFVGATLTGAFGILTNQSGDLSRASSNSLTITSVTVVMLGFAMVLLLLGRYRDSRPTWIVAGVGMAALVMLGFENIGTTFLVREQVSVVLVALIALEIVGSSRFPTTMPRAFRVATLGMGVVTLVSVSAYSLGFRHYQHQLASAVRSTSQPITQVDGATNPSRDESLYQAYYWGFPNAFLAMDLAPTLTSPRFLPRNVPGVRSPLQGIRYNDIPLPFFVHFSG